MTRWRISADTGGTFTDCLAEGPEGQRLRAKVLSSGRLRFRVLEGRRDGWLRFDCPLPASADWLPGAKAFLNGHPVGAVLDVQADALLVSASLEVRRGDLLELDTGLEAPVLALRLMLPPEATGVSLRLGTTKGTNALLERQGARVALFLSIGFEDLLRVRDQKRPDILARAIARQPPLYHRVYGVRGRMDSQGNLLEPLDVDALAAQGRSALADGCEVAAVCLLNSWCNPAQEAECEAVLRAAGFDRVILSSTIRPLIKYLDRSETTLVDAMLSPILDQYLDRIQAELAGQSPWIMTSAGGLVSRDRFHPVDSLVSGPAGGLMGAIEAGRRVGWNRILTLDMGGTSTDVSRWRDRFELRQQIQVGEARLMTPALPIATVAAGGGSLCQFREGRLQVGPASAGADPGPAAYGAGGPLTLTDIHLLLGRIDAEGFAVPLRMEDSWKRLQELQLEAGAAGWQSLAEGLLDIATERMTQAIRSVTLREGEDPSDYGLVVFGGAGGLHACRLADQLNITRVLFPPDAGILSARGIHFAPRETVREEQCFQRVEDEDAISRAFAALTTAAGSDLAVEGVEPSNLDAPVCTAFVRIKGQEQGLPVDWLPGGGMAARFQERFASIFGYFPRDPALEVVKLRVHLAERVEVPSREVFPENGGGAAADRWVTGFVEGRDRQLPVFIRESLQPGWRIPGPAIIRDLFGTCFIEPQWEAVCGSAGGILLTPQQAADTGNARLRLPEVESALVLNRLEGLVEDMGEQLRRTGLSTNIRERLDYSCALLDPEGRLVVNAPHIPVHLGAMGVCVRECLRRLRPGPGDVIITNHPAFGGSHLPDITLFGPLFDNKGRLAGFVANRAHHAEWGGRSPGSMPADATSLAEEGILLSPRWLIRRGKDCFEHLDALLRQPPWPSRGPRENRIDLEAQLASLQLGRQRFAQLIQDHGAASVREQVAALRVRAASIVSGLLFARGPFTAKSCQILDDGHAIHVGMESDGRRLRIDFSHTSGRHPGNLNATPAIVRSAILYVLRLMIRDPVPLNEGLLDPVEIILPECFLNPLFTEDPAACPAVVGGNVETSQRLVDALLSALGEMACGQGTMNNLLFGNERFGYYETIGGGAGAGEGFRGASGVHVHMTNTAITDPEILEQRFPVRCRAFGLRHGSGGEGRYAGGDGLVRELEFLEPVSLSFLSQRRRTGPEGADGGGSGSPGQQWVIQQDGQRVAIPGIVQMNLQAGEGIRIETPGGGGWGAAPTG